MYSYVATQRVLNANQVQFLTCRVLTSATAAPALLELGTPKPLLLAPSPFIAPLLAALKPDDPPMLGAEKPEEPAELPEKALEEELEVPNPIVVTPAPLLLLDEPPLSSWDTKSAIAN